MNHEDLDDKLILALETAVGSGSIAVLRGQTLLAVSTGSPLQPARAGDVLRAIKELLEGAGFTLKDLSLIAVSTGPGSYSGIRIGLATAIGLKNALGIECIGVSVLEAIANSSTASGKVVAAVPVGKNDIAWQAFEKSDGYATATSEPKLSSLVEFADALADDDASTVLTSAELLDRIDREKLRHAQSADSTVNLAALIGRLAVVGDRTDVLKPLYLRAGAGF